LAGRSRLAEKLIRLVPPQAAHPIGHGLPAIGITTHAYSFVVASLRVSAGLRDRKASSVLAFSIALAAIICCSLPALGETRALSYGQGPQAQQSNPEQQDPDYNGEDFTRPVRSFEMRFLYQTSPGTTAPTQQGNWLLRLNWKA